MPRKEGTVTKTFTFEGKRYFVTGADNDDAAIKADRRKEELEKRIPIASAMTVLQWADRWVETYKEGRVNDRWLADIKGMIKNYITPAIGSKQIYYIRPAHLERIMAANQKSYSFNTKLYDLLSQIFRDAYRNDIIPNDISVKITKNVTEKYQKRRSLTDEERKLLLRILQEHHGKLFCYLMLYAGLRPGEVCALQWSDIDLKAKTITISRALKSDGIIRDEPKTSAGRRVIPIPKRFYLSSSKNRLTQENSLSV